MRVKSLFIVIVINIFLMLFGSVLLEYLSMSDRFATLETTVQEAFEMALDTSTASEEMFSDSFQSRVSSYASSASKEHVYASSLLYRDGDWYQINSYLLAAFYDMNGRLPRNSGEINSARNISGASDDLSFIYKWLFGDIGTDYNNGSLSWANRSKSKRMAYVAGLATNRQPTSRFKEYYDNIGKYHETVGFLKQRNGTMYTLSPMAYPTLSNMGLKLSSYNDVNSSVTADNFTSSYHEGKTQGGQKSIYYLTPASLGVTYVPVEVLKPVFLANLETLCRLNKLASGDIDSITATQMEATLRSADYCVPTDVYPNGGSTPVSHTVSSSENIVTDGIIEYDLNSAKVQVDYFYVDFGASGRQSQNSVIASRIVGCISAYNLGVDPNMYSASSLRLITLQKFLDSAYDSGTNVNSSAFTSVYEGVRNKRLIARVTVKIKCHIVYTSPIIQWLCYKDGSNHFDMKQYLPSSGIVRDKDGVWYQYTTYYSQTR